jgi:photosystem II stability/assembly factor-like uncharacterized protein/tetratricopeptide (TPR) repeat protein
MRRGFLVLVLACLVIPSGLEAADVPAFADAPLHAVQFVDASEGWAVGDDGVVWHTIDGGQTWERQPTGVRASLRSLHFVDPFIGFVVGRESLPHGAGSTGVILATRDGGVSWHRLSMKTLPGLNRVKFLDKQNGFVAGDGSDQFPSGAFFTQDGGKSWHMLSSPPSGKNLGERGAAAIHHSPHTTWLAADFLDAKTGVLAGAWGRLGPVRQRQIVPSDLDPSVLRGRTVRAVQLQDKTAWAVGGGGLALISEDTAGKRWGLAELQLPAEIQKCWDFHAVHFVGERGWIAGRPGSVILHTADRGQSWEVQQTGQPLPVNGLFFLNEKQGWAVGELGTILGTNDGGKTWKVQQRGGHRAAVLIVTVRADGVPSATISLLGGDEGYLCAAVQVVCADPHSAAPGKALEGARLAEAMRQAGGCGGEVLAHFPLPKHLAQADAEQLAKFWGNSNDEARGREELERQLVLALRIWQPEVVITDNPDSSSPSGHTGAVVALATHRAFQKAALADAYPEQIAKLDLQPWSARKLYSKWETAEGAHVAIDLNEAKPRLLGSPCDYAASAASLLHEVPATPSPLVYYRLLDSRIDDAEKHKWLMQGLQLQPGGQARRELPDVDDETWNGIAKEIAQSVQKRRDLQAIAKQQLQDAKSAGRMLAAVEPALAGLSEDRAAETAFALANQFAQAGQWPLAKEVFLLMIDRYPAHRLTPEACRWLIRQGASSEARRREELSQFHVTAEYKFRPRPTPADGESQRFTQVQREREISLLRRWEDIRKWYKSSLTVGDHLAALGMIHFLEPEVQSCLQAAHRNLGDFEEAQKWYTQMKLRNPTGPWHEAAAAELWLVNRDGLPPKPMASCTQTDTPPFLDGKLDDACWNEAKVIKLKDAGNETAEAYATEARLSYDLEFLYLAVRCAHPNDGHHKPPVTPRPRDADLRNYDRIGLLLDLDRDYSTCFHLQVDQRGCLCEECWGDKSWNPKWYVAIHSDETSWSIEAAIPLTELTGDKLALGTTWACNVVRTIPGKGVQAMSSPADADPRPEGMGLLTFIPQERKRGAASREVGNRSK